MTGTVRILQGDARSLPLPDASVDLIVTSPPYWALRSYSDNGEHYDGQMGSEATPREFVAALVACTAEWMRVLKPSGSLFVNLGDKYAGSPGNNKPHTGSAGIAQAGQQRNHQSLFAAKRVATGAPPKSLIGLPWRYALACMDDLGLILRAEIIWAKPNGLPESVTDRVRRSHEQVFHFTRQPRYYSAVDEVREGYAREYSLRDATTQAQRMARDAEAHVNRLANAATRDPNQVTPVNPLGKLPGSVWEIPSAPLTVPARLGVDHFAAYPPELCRRIILGWSPPGICTECGEGRRPVSAAEAFEAKPFAATQQASGRTWHGGNPATRSLGIAAGERQRTITGYACACPDTTAPTRPAVVLDPFGGTGTTALVASVLGRDAVTVDMSADYCRLAAWRTSDPGERCRALGVPKPPPVSDGQGDLFEAVS